VTEVAAAPASPSETVYRVPDLKECMTRLGDLHPRLCPRQVLGVRIGLHAGSLLELDLPRTDNLLLALVETDGCFADGVSVTTGCWLGRRTLRLVDYGKVAATLADLKSGRAVRVWPHPAARARAWSYAANAPNRWHAQLLGYQLMPVEQLLCMQPVQLQIPVARLLGQPGPRELCMGCGEEILNQRALATPGGPRCPGCFGSHRYYRRIGAFHLQELPASEGQRTGARPTRSQA